MYLSLQTLACVSLSGILQGTSQLLVALDMSDVRKIVRVCKTVEEHFALSETVHSMDELVEFVKNLSPVLKRMTADVEARLLELTYRSHCEMLQKCLDQIKALTPTLISSVKIYIHARQSGACTFHC